MVPRHSRRDPVLSPPMPWHHVIHALVAFWSTVTPAATMRYHCRPTAGSPMNARPMSPPITRSVMLGAALLASVAAFSTTSSAAEPDPRPLPPSSAAPVAPVGPGSTADPSPPPSDPTSGPIRVEVAPGIDDASLMPKWIAERNPDLGQALALPGHEQWIDVEILGATYEYRVTVTPMRDDAPVGPAIQPVTCDCNSQELLERVDAEVRRAVQTLQKEPPVEPIEDHGDDSRPSTGEQDDGRGGIPELTWVGKTGIALIAVGGAGAITGAVMVGVNRGDPLSDGYGYLERDLRNPTGYVFLGVGGAVLVGGVVPLVLDLTRCTRNPNAPGCEELVAGRPSSRGRRAPRRWAPWASTQGAGITVSGRF